MNYLKQKRHRIYQSLFVCILSSVSIILCLISVTNRSIFETQIKDIQKLLTLDTDQIAVISVNYIEDESSFGENINTIKNEIRNRYGVCCGGYEENIITFEELIGQKEYILKNKEIQLDANIQEFPECSDVFEIDSEILQFINCELKEDMFLPEKKGEEIYYPIYVSSVYRDIIPIGRELTECFYKTKYIVKGYIEDFVWFDQNGPFSYPITHRPGVFVAPFSEIEKTASIVQMATIGQIFIDYSSISKEDIRSIEKYAIDKGIKMNIESVQERLEQMIIENQEICKVRNEFMLIVVICSLISISTLLCMEIVFHKREYGIKMAFGISMGRIMIEYGIKKLLLIGGSFAVDIVILQRYYQVAVMPQFCSLYQKTLRYEAIPIVAFFVILVTLGTVIAPLCIISKQNVSQLIRE